MAIIGGAGNPVGGSFTGAAQALEIIGDHCYGYSGIVASDATNYVTLLSFTTGNYYSVVQWSSDYSSNSGDNAVYSIKLNESEISSYFVNGGVTAPSDRQPFEVVIPPYTEVLVRAKNHQGNETIYFLGRLTGRIYRTRD